MIRAYFKHNRDFNSVLANQTTINRDRFTKMLALGLLDIVVTLPVTIVGLVEDLLQSEIVGFYPGWTAAHEHFHRIGIVTEEQWRSAGFWFNFTIRFDQWIIPVYSVIFFLLFGLTKQKRAWYRGLFWKLVKPLGFKPRAKPEVSEIMFKISPIVNFEARDTQMVTM